MRYTFDESGAVCGISLWTNGSTSWTKYYFTKNLQGDVLGVYRSDSGSFTKVAEYSYDSWGNVLSATGELAETNPFRYRGYYYDAETGFYYLQSRYYDPAIGRFINADGFASTGQDFLGFNMFAYCNNNPVHYVDPHGERAIGPSSMLMCDGVSTHSDPHRQQYGLVNGQCVQSFSNEPFGKSTYGKASCAVIATYNAMLLIGQPMSLGDVGDEYLQLHGTLWNGRFGVAPWHIASFLNAHNISAIGCNSTSKVAANVSEGDVVIFTVFNSKYNPFQGLHTMAAQYTEGSYIVYNETNYSTNASVFGAFSEIYSKGWLYSAFIIKVGQ